MTRRSRRRLSLAIAISIVAVPATTASAQLTVAGLAWGTPAAQVRTHLEARGWRFRGADQDGDHVFGGPAASEAVATLADGRLVGMEMRWPSTAAGARARYRAITGSLRRAHGRPATVDDESITWSRGDSLVYGWLGDGRGASPEPAAGITGWGPGYHAEIERRSQLEREETERIRAGRQAPDSLLAGDWEIVFSNAHVLTRLDVAGARPAGPGRYRARLREDWMFTRRLASGTKYSLAVREMEIDCRAMQARVLRIIPGWAEHSAAAGPVPGAAAWTAPATGSPEDRAIRKSCALMHGA